jgi:hypothetical protein
MTGAPTLEVSYVIGRLEEIPGVPAVIIGTTRRPAGLPPG